MTDTPLPRLADASPFLGALSRRRRDVGLVCLAALVCGAGAMFLAPLGAGTAAAAVAGIATPLLWRHGRMLWPGAWLGSFALAVLGGRSFLSALFLALAATAVAASAATALRRLRVGVTLERRRDVGAYVSAAIAAAALIALASFAASSFDDGNVAPPAVALRALAAGLTCALVLGVALVVPATTVGATPLRLRAGELAAASAALTLAVATPFLPSPFAMPIGAAVAALLCRLAASAGTLAAATAASSALVLRLVVERLALPVPTDEALWQGAVELGTLAVLWGALPPLVSAWRAESAARDRGWQDLVETAGIGTIALNATDGRIELSPRWQHLLGVAALPTTADAFWALVHPDDEAALKSLLGSTRRNEASLDPAVVRLRDGAGHWRRLHITRVAALSDARGTGPASRAIAQDCTDAAAADDRARVADRVYDQLGEGLLVTDAQGRVERMNARYAQITGETPESIVGTVPRLLRSALTSVAAGDSESQMRRLGTWQGEVVDRRRNGELCTLSLTVTQVRDASGTVTHHAVLVSDLTQAREHREQLERKALTDELTQLPNRVRLVQLLEGEMQASDRHGSLLTVVSIDLDHFKALNDRFGSETCDRLLVELARRLDAAQREVGNDVLARIGGDEFVLLLRSVDLDGCRRAVQRVLEAISQPIALVDGGEPVTLSASLGATVYPNDRADAETLLRHAGHALWGVKQAGRNAFQFFDAERHRQAEARFSALGRLQEAFDADEFCLHFQPKVDMRRGKVLGAEALLRWSHPEQGIVPPGQFLPLIENTSLAVDLGTWVLRKGVEQLAHWHRQGLEMTLSVNVSARLLQEPQFGKYIAGLLQRHRAPLGRMLILEVLETAALKDMDRTRRLMDECHALGVRFALDDFGTGFSNLTYLRQLPVDMLKIDRSFVANMLNDKEDLAIVEGVLALARTFDCKVVAEGVETAEQARRLIRMGCDIGQGHGIAAAMPMDQLLTWVADFKGVEGVSVERRPLPA